MADIDINVPAGQDTQTHTETRGGRVISPQVAGALELERLAAGEQETAQERVGDAQSLQETVRAEQQDRQADELRRQRIDLAADQQAQKDRMDAAVASADSAEEAFANHKFEDYWSHKSVGQRLATAFQLFGGGFSARMLGSDRNPAADALYRDMDRDFARQKSDLEKKRVIAASKRQGIGDLRTQFGHEDAALALKFAKANEVTAAEMVQRLTESGVPLKEAESNVIVAGLRARGAEKRREALQMYDKTLSETDVNARQIGGPASAAADDSLVYDARGNAFHNAPTPAAAKEFRDKQRALTDLEKATDELEANYKEYGVENPFKITEGSAARAGIEKRITLATKTIGELGALSGPDQGLADDIAGGKLGSVLARPGGIANLRRMQQNSLNTSISQIGATPTAANRARFAPVPDDLAEATKAQGGTPVPASSAAAAAPAAKAPGAKPARPSRKDRAPSADIKRMLEARSRGEHAFDGILRAEGF